MSFKFKIRVYQEDNIVKLQLDMLADEGHEGTIEWRDCKIDFHHDLNIDMADLQFDRTPSSNDAEELFRYSTFTYSLPANPFTAELLMRNLIKNVITTAKRCLGDNENTVCMINDDIITSATDFNILVQNWYEDTTASIKSDQYPWVFNYRAKTTNDIIEENKISQITDSRESVSVKIKLLLEFLQTYQYQKKELNRIFYLINSAAKKRLIELCLGKLSHYGYKKNVAAVYDMGYTEVQLLHYGQFWLSGGMGFLNLKNNAVYQEFYAEGARNHDETKAELSYLFNCLGLEIDPRSDFHDVIIFTAASTKILKSMGLHFNEQYLKELMRVKFHGNLFAQAYRHAENNEQPCYFNCLPPELMAVVSEMELPSNVSPEEGSEARRIIWPTLRFG